MADFASRLKQLRTERDLLQKELADKVDIPRSTIAAWESGNRTPELGSAQILADFFEVSLDYLLGRVDDPHGTYLPPEAWPIEEVISLPILGVIRAGEPIYADQHIDGYFLFPKNLLPCPEGKYFLLRVRGDSMIDAGIKEDNLVLVKEQDWLDNSGDIMVVIVNGDEATVKRVYQQDMGLILQPENKNYQPAFISKKDMEGVRLIGKVIKVIADVK